MSQADYTTIAPKVSGYIADVKVEDNQTVKAGDVLAVIDDRDFRTALVQAKADVASAKADVDNIAAQLEEQQSVIQQAEAAITADQAGVTFAQGRLHPLSQPHPPRRSPRCRTSSAPRASCSSRTPSSSATARR